MGADVSLVGQTVRELEGLGVLGWQGSAHNKALHRSTLAFRLFNASTFVYDYRLFKG